MPAETCSTEANKAILVARYDQLTLIHISVTGMFNLSIEYIEETELLRAVLLLSFIAFQVSMLLHE